MEKELADLLENNNISDVIMTEALHEDLREYILGEICISMKKDKMATTTVRNIYHKCADNLIAVKRIVFHFCGCSLPENDLKWLDKCLHAALKKSSRRVKISDTDKNRLWITQENKCAICGKNISYDQICVDHIIPWDFVGDELENNYQVLCSHCNRRKSNRISQHTKRLVVRK